MGGEGADVGEEPTYFYLSDAVVEHLHYVFFKRIPLLLLLEVNHFSVGAGEVLFEEERELDGLAEGDRVVGYLLGLLFLLQHFAVDHRQELSPVGNRGGFRVRQLEGAPEHVGLGELYFEVLS